MPSTPRAVVRRVARTRPSRSTAGPANIRVRASLAENAVKKSAATAALSPWSLRAARVSQLLAEPSPSSTPSMTRPMSSSRQSSQPRSQCRSAAPPARAAGRVCLRAAGRGGIPRPRRAAAATTTASPMNWAGLMPRAAQAAPIPDPAAAPRDQAACITASASPGGPLDGGALHVDQHVERADARPRDHEGDRDSGDRAERSARGRAGSSPPRRAAARREAAAAAQPVQTGAAAVRPMMRARRSPRPAAARWCRCRCSGPP